MQETACSAETFVTTKNLSKYYCSCHVQFQNWLWSQIHLSTKQIFKMILTSKWLCLKSYPKQTGVLSQHSKTRNYWPSSASCLRPAQNTSSEWPLWSGAELRSGLCRVRQTFHPTQVSNRAQFSRTVQLGLHRASLGIGNGKISGWGHSKLA